MPPKLSFGRDLFSSLKQRLREWIRREIVDDDPWDEPPSFWDVDRSNLDRSNIRTGIDSKTDSEANSETNSD